MRIAVCIENEELRSQIHPLLDRYAVQRAGTVTYRFFETDFDLLGSLAGGEYDAIVLGAISNITELIAEIREKNQWVRLIPVTTATQWTDAVYGREVWYCLPALVSEGLLFAVLNRLEADLKQDTDVGLVIKSRQGIVHILFSDLEYVEVMNKSLCFYLCSGATVDVSAPLAEYEAKLLSCLDFIKVHRAYIVNLRHVQKLEPGCILTRCGRSVPVSKYVYPELRKDYLCRLSDPGAVPTQTAPPSPAPPTPERLAYRILLVDDEEDARSYWSRILEKKGCQVVPSDCAKAATRAAAEGTYDCVLLDVILGNESGFDLCAALARQTGAPVIFLSTKSESAYQREGFHMGGVDYITKDTEDELFWLKVEARISRGGLGRPPLRFGPLCIDLVQRRVELESVILTLSTVEFDLLWLLTQRAGEVCTPEEIYRSLWDGSQGSSTQSVQIQLSRLRRKLEKACPSHSFIETVWGEGYRFVSPESGEVRL